MILVPNSSKNGYYIGRDLGLSVRTTIGLDQLDDDASAHEIVFPDNTVVTTSSFLDGLFATSFVYLLQSIGAKYKITGPENVRTSFREWAHIKSMMSIAFSRQ